MMRRGFSVEAQFNQVLPDQIYFGGASQLRERNDMRAILLTLLTAGIVGMAGSSPAAARDYRFCLQSPEVGIPGDCSYSTYAQCQASASGRYAYCNINPRVAFSERPYRRRHHDYDGDY